MTLPMIGVRPVSSLGTVLSGRRGMSPIMVGRSAALHHLRHLVDVARAVGDVGTALDQPAVALVAGEAGIGKTRLVRELVEHLHDDVVALTMGAQPGSIGRSGDALTTLSVVGRAPGTGDPAGIGVIAAGSGAWTRAGERDVGDAVQAIRSEAGGRPAVLVVEDLHWIDAASALVIDRLAQEEWPELVVIGTYRIGDLARGAPGGDLVLRLERRHVVEQLRLDRLDRGEMGALMAAIAGTPPSSAVVEAVHRRSGGIPFVVEELMRCCSLTSPDDVLAAQLPWSLDEAVRQQIAALDPTRRVVVEAMAVFGRPMPFGALAAVAGLDEHELLDVLRSLVADTVVVEAGDDAFWFTHALVADAVERQLLGRERRRLHDRCFDVLSADVTSSFDSGTAGMAPAGVGLRDVADPAALVRHALGAGRFDEVVAIACTGADRYLAEGSSFQALRLAAEALAEEPDSPALLRIATDAAWRIDFLDEALVTARRWVDAAVDPVDRVVAVRFVARLGAEMGDDETARSATEQLEALIETLDQPEQADSGQAEDLVARNRLIGVAAASVAQIHMITLRSEEAIGMADRALVAARAAGDEVTAAHALVERASARIGAVAGGPATGDDGLAADMRAALAAARAVDEPVLIARAVNNLLAMVPVYGEEGSVLLRELEAATVRSGFDKGSHLWWRVEAAWGAGDLELARRRHAEASQWSSRPTSREKSLRGVTALAFEEGRLADARAFVDQSTETMLPVPVVQRSLLLLRFHVAAGDHEAAHRVFTEMVAAEPLHNTAAAVDETLMAVEAALAAGCRPADVRSAVFDRWLVDHGSSEELRGHAEGLLLAVEGRHDDAVAALQPVLDRPVERLTKVMRGTLRTVLASELLATGDRDGALAAVRRVLDDDLARWPGVRRDRAEALLRRLEGATHRPAGALTGREREIAGLLAEGLTNGGLAERLYISPKTVAVHVSNILAKLGLSSRAEIAAWAVRNGLDAEPASSG